jgi:mono/diheme cytochrome c family protein
MTSFTRRYFAQFLAVALLLFVISGMLMFWSATPGHALPEYANRTGEPCATCHVSPGGGGPRTLRGLIWASRGKLDKVPELAGVLAAPGAVDGADIYEIACAACHGKHGEGLFGRELVNSGLSAGKIESQILNGRVRSGMPAFEGKFTAAQLQALTTFVAEMSSGAATPMPDSFPLESGHLTCSPSPDNPNCGGN